MREQNEAEKPPIEFEAYRHVMDEFNAGHPQYQGMDQEEYRQALNDPSVLFSVVETETGELKIPQLAPIHAYSWLNPSFYKKRFPQEYDKGEIMCFSPIPVITPENQVRSRLFEMAENQGILAFDLPSSIKFEPEDVVNMLNSLGITTEIPELQGTQTYFAGQTRLDRQHPRHERPLTPSQAYEVLVKKRGTETIDFKNGVTLEAAITGEEADRMFSFFSEAYETIADHPCKQAIDPQEFMSMLADPSVAKIIARANGLAESLCLITNDIDGLSWVNSNFYKDRYSDKYQKGQVIWFPAIATNPDPNVSGHNAPKIVELIAQLGEEGDNDMLVVFDTPDMNKEFLPQYLEVSINATPEASVSFNSIGEQKYYTLRLTGLK